MRIFKRLVVFITVFSISILTVKGAGTCDTATTAKLNREVANIRVSYEEMERVPQGDFAPPDWWEPEMGLDVLPKELYFKVNLTNLSENFYAVITNNINSDTITLTYQDSVDGVASFDWTNLSNVTRLTIKVYATAAAGCEGQSFKTITQTLPKYNYYSNYDVCANIPDYSLCQKFVTYDREIDYETFMNGAEQEIVKQEEEENNPNGDNENFWDKTINFIKEHKNLFIIGGILVVVGACSTIIIVRNRRRKEI